MDTIQIVESVSWTTVLTILLGAYALAVAAFLILENRSPQSTFAWLFLLLVFPLGGLLIYVMVGETDMRSAESEVSESCSRAQLSPIALPGSLQNNRRS